jgi:putative PIN family toxin of toxin-antitoxin system
MKVVLDTNVFISGIFWRGDSERVLYSWFDNDFKLIVSKEIIQEIIEVLMDFKIQLPLEDILLWISILSINSEVVEPEEKINIVQDDPDDDKFIEAGVKGMARYIVTQDNHLLKIKEFRGIKILSPKEFLKIIF